MVLDWPQNAEVDGIVHGMSLAAELARLNDVTELVTADALLPNSDWMQALLNQVSDYIFVKDRKSRFVMANRQVALDLGFDKGLDLIGKTDLELHPIEIGRQMMAAEEEVMTSQAPRFDFEEVVVLPDGRQKWFSASKFPVMTDTREVVGIVGICREITVRKRAEMLQQGQNKVLQEIANGLPLSDVLDTLVRTIESQLDGIMGSVMLVNEAGTNLETATAPNLPRAYSDQVNGVPVGPKVGSCGTAVHRKENVFVEDLHASELWADFLGIVKPFGLRSCWSVPFFGKDQKVLGTFGLYSREVRRPTAEERNIALEAARLASIAVDRDRAESRIRYLAHHDVLTGLPNRQEFKNKLEEKVAWSRRTGEPVAIVFVDLDNFKSVNDSFGHAVGDEVLRIIAGRIMSFSSQGGEAIRYGGDEFVLLVEGDMALKLELRQLMAQLRDEVGKTIRMGELSFHMTCSMGAACFPEDASDAAQLLKNADCAMFEAKSLGKNGFVTYERTETGKVVNRLTMLEDMRSGLENGDFLVEYQPQYDLLSGRIVGAEALVRWEHPKYGRLMPDDFISLAEESGLIVPLGRWVLHEACRQNKKWQDAGLSPITIGVNVSARQFRDATLISDVCEVLDDTELPAHYLELEVTESLLIQNSEQAADIMDGFRRIGVKLAMDDFGTGYSSLTALKKYPLTRLKIDRSFIRDLDYDEDDRCIARAIISLGRELGLNVVAEGVETAKQQAFLASFQCETVQGFHFGPPMSPERLGALLGMTLTHMDARFG